MDYEGQICRAPMERAAYKLPIMVGCCYNQCRFCDLFKHLKFRIIPIEEVEADIRRVCEAGGSPRKIFLGYGSAFALRTDYLKSILDLIHKYFPQCREINMNATVTSISDKSDEELQILAENGVKHLYIGLESGLEDVLCFMNKGNTVEQLTEAVKRIRQLIRLICEDLNKAGGHSMKYEGFHDFISFHVWGTLPRDGEKMISKIDKVIAEYAEKQEEWQDLKACCQEIA